MPTCKPQLHSQLISQLLLLVSLFILLCLVVVHQLVVSQPLHHMSLIFIWENKTCTFHTSLWWIRLSRMDRSIPYAALLGHCWLCSFCVIIRTFWLFWCMYFKFSGDLSRFYWSFCNFRARTPIPLLYLLGFLEFRHIEIQL